MRINARLDPERTRKLEFLKRRSHVGTTEVVKRGIDALYDEASQKPGRAFEILTESGFIGRGDGPEDLSETYKEKLLEILEEKHGHR